MGHLRSFLIIFTKDYYINHYLHTCVHWTGLHYMLQPRLLLFSTLLRSRLGLHQPHIGSSFLLLVTRALLQVTSRKLLARCLTSSSLAIRAMCFFSLLPRVMTLSLRRVVALAIVALGCLAEDLWSVKIGKLIASTWCSLACQWRRISKSVLARILHELVLIFIPLI